MESIITFADNPFEQLAKKLSEIYSGGTVGIIYDNELDREQLVKALYNYKNSARCYSIKDLISSKIPDNIRAIIGAGSRRIIPLAAGQKAEILCFLAQDYVIDYWGAHPKFIVFDNSKIAKRNTQSLALGYSNATAILTSILDYLSLAQLKIGEPLSPLKELQAELCSLLIENKHQDNYIQTLLLTIEKAYNILTRYDLYPLLVSDILSTSSRCPYPALALEPAEYCRQEFFTSYLLLCIFNLFAKKRFTKPLLPKDINAIISLFHSLEIDYKLLNFENTLSDDYTDKFFLLQEEEGLLEQFVLAKTELKKLSFNIRALMGKEFFKGLSYYDCLCYTLIANELKQKQGLTYELASSGFIDALMEKAGAELSKYKAISV